MDLARLSLRSILDRVSHQYRNNHLVRCGYRMETLESRVMLTATPLSADMVYALGSREAPLAIETSALATTTVVTPVLSVSARVLNCGQEVTVSAKLPGIKIDGKSRLEFYDNGVLLGYSTVYNTTMTWSSDVLKAGTHSFTAIYYNAQNVASALSNSIDFTVKQADPKLKLSVFQTGTPAASPVFKIESTVLEMNKYNGDFDNYEGTFKLYEGDTLLHTIQLTEYVNLLLYKLPAPLSQGTHTITVRYSGGNNFVAASSSLTLDIQPIKPAITLDVPTTTAPNTSINIYATLSAKDMEITSGSVSLYDGDTLLSTNSVNYYGTANFTVAGLSVGTHRITAKYSGYDSAGLGESTSAVYKVVVSRMASSISLTVTDNRGLDYVDHAASTADTVSLVADYSIIGTGIVSFYDGSKLIGTDSAIGNGWAWLDIQLSAGTHNLTAVFEGNASTLASASNVVKEVIKPIQQVDLLILYTNTVANDWTDAETIINNIQSEVDLTNEALMNSNIYLQINTVAIQQVNYNDSGDYETDITRLSNATDGYLDEVAALRRQYHADLVSMFVNDAQDNIIGLGSTLLTSAGDVDAAYSIIDYNGSLYTLAHELGHNFGARHDSKNDDGKTGFQTGHGYVHYVDGDYDWHDIMAYGPGDPIPYYSNPRIRYYDIPTGTASANAASVINMNAAIVANYSNLLAKSTKAIAPTAAITTIGTRTITGWAYDGNAGKSPVEIRIDIDGVEGKVISANSATPLDAPTYAFGKHGFVYTLPKTVSAGAHTVQLYVKDAGTGKFVMCASDSLNVDPKPELEVTFGNTSLKTKTYKPGDTITTQVTITNTGVNDAEGTKDNPIEINVYQSSDGAYDSSDTLIKTFLLTSRLASGASKSFTITMKIPGNTSGDIYLIAVADATNAITEVSENNTFVAPSATHVTWQFGAATGSSSLVLTDDDGTKVILSLSGPGSGLVIHDESGWSIILNETTTSSSLTISTSKSKLPGDDGRFIVSTIAGSDSFEGIKSISAATTDLAGNVSFNAPVNSLTLGDVISTSTISIKSNDPEMVVAPRITLGAVQDLTLSVAGTIKSLSALNWKDTDDTTDSITTDSIGTLSITGNSKRALAGDFAADLYLLVEYDSLITQSLASARIAGALKSSTWNINRDAGSITVLGDTGSAESGWTLSTSGHTIKSVSFKDIVNASLTGYSTIGSITAERWQAGSIQASTIDKITITGRQNAFAGDFGADMNVTSYFDWSVSPAVRKSIHQITINGSLPATHWSVTGQIDSLTVKGSTGEASGAWVLTDTPGVGKLSLGDVVNAEVNVLGDVGTLSATRWQKGTMEAAIITTINVTGVKKSYSGDFNGSLNITGHGLTDSYAVKSLNVAGTISDSTIRAAGNIEKITLGSISHSQIYAGVLSSQLSGLPTANHFLSTLYTIGSITFGGMGTDAAVLQASSIAAGMIKKVKMMSTASSLVDADGTSDEFGFRSLMGAVAQYTGPDSFMNFVSGLDAGV